MKKPNKYAHLADGTVMVMLERRDGSVLPGFVDAGDWEKIRGHRWSAHKRGMFYVITNVSKGEGKKATLSMHTLLLPDAEVVDHRDGNGLNNRRTNIRAATQLQNMQNQRKQKSGTTSQFKGVYWHKATNKWAARIGVNGRQRYLGLFTSEVEAARAYDTKALQHFGDFSKTNFVQNTQLKAA
jgi:hypothetical protein